MAPGSSLNIPRLHAAWLRKKLISKQLTARAGVLSRVQMCLANCPDRVTDDALVARLKHELACRLEALKAKARGQEHWQRKWSTAADLD